jgi:hypothetical protein
VIEHLLLPDVDRRIIELARSLDRPGSTTSSVHAPSKTYLRTSFTYTTDLLNEEVKDPLAHFLLRGDRDIANTSRPPWPLCFEPTTSRAAW